MVIKGERSDVRYGVVFSGNFPLNRTLAGAQLADELGFDSCWLGEDYFYQGGIATATAVADRTSRIAIGLGILTPLPRHPALTVMELGTLDHIAEGRIIIGYGAGVLGLHATVSDLHSCNGHVDSGRPGGFSPARIQL